VRDHADKAQQAVRFMHVAGISPPLRPPTTSAVLMRLVLVHADMAQRYLGLWFKALDRYVTTRPVARAARTPLKRLRRAACESANPLGRERGSHPTRVALFQRALRELANYIDEDRRMVNGNHTRC
jgi:hypothetical protein